MKMLRGTWRLEFGHLWEIEVIDMSPEACANPHGVGECVYSFLHLGTEGEVWNIINGIEGSDRSLACNYHRLSHG